MTQNSTNSAQPKPAIPLQTLSVVDLAHDGRGVGRAISSAQADGSGKTVFVHGALPGEQVLARRIGRNRRFDEAVCEQVIEASADRVTPQCPYFEQCGGCALQHLAVDAQREFKHKRLVDNLTRLGEVTPQQWWAPMVGPTWGYRRRARLSVRLVAAKGRVLVGFREKQGRYVADMHHCAILDPRFGQQLESLSLLIASLSVPDAIPQLEVACGDDSAAMVVRHMQPLTAPDLRHLQRWSEAHDIAIYLQSGGPDTVQRLCPDSHQLSYHLPEFDVRFEFGPEHFIQVNADINRQLVRRAVDLLALRGGERVLDLFCGLGNFSLPLGRAAAQVVGVEGDAALVAAAQANARRNGMDHCQFVSCDLNGDHSKQDWAQRQFDAVLLDPPRAGAEVALPWIARSGAKSVVYVSCNPATLARDAGLLVHQHGYTLVGAGIADMFPHTAHVESIALFQKPS